MLTVKNGSIQPGSFHLLGIAPETQYGGLTVCVSGGGAGVDKTSRAGFRLGVEKSPKMPQNPHRPLHALLARFLLGFPILLCKKHLK